MENVCVIGLGTVGYPTALYIFQQGFSTIGFDITEKDIKEFQTFTKWDNVPNNIDVYAITVNTDWKNGKPNVSSVFDVSEKIANRNKDVLVAIESTVPVGTCRKISDDYGLKNMVHVPHRYWGGDPVNYGVRQNRVIGAINEDSLKNGLAFYNQLNIPLHLCPTIETAELCKVSENAYRYIQVAFAESLALICKENDVSFEELRKATNTKWNVEIFEARDGIGGVCLPLSIEYLRWMKKGKAPMLDGAISIDEAYKKMYFSERK